jgi:hypothetical protein
MNHLRLMATLVLALVISEPAKSQDHRYTLVDRELEYLMEIWPGDFDNREQLSFDAGVGKTPL